MSEYDDEFVVVVDRRALDGKANEENAFRTPVNDCQGRMIIVRPVSDLMEVPSRYPRLIPAANLQSLSVALGRPGEGLSQSFLDLPTACSKCGVTAIRSVGRGAFPQLAYSWDGLVPLDLVSSRPVGLLDDRIRCSL